MAWSLSVSRVGKAMNGFLKYTDGNHGKDGHILTIVDGQILTIRPTDGQNLTILFGRPGHFLQAGKRDDLFLWSMINTCLNLPIVTNVPL